MLNHHALKHNPTHPTHPTHHHSKTPHTPPHTPHTHTRTPPTHSHPPPTHTHPENCRDLVDFWSRVSLKFISAFIFESILPKFTYTEKRIGRHLTPKGVFRFGSSGEHPKVTGWHLWSLSWHLDGVNLLFTPLGCSPEDPFLRVSNDTFSGVKVNLLGVNLLFTPLDVRLRTHF